MKPVSAERATAIHGAAHAVMGYILGRPFVAISVEADKQTLGRASHRPPGEWFQPPIKITTWTRRLAEDHAMICLAGPELEAAVTGSPTGAEHDLSCAIDLLMPMCASTAECEAYTDWIRQCVLATIGRPRFRTLAYALADAVQDAGTLSWRRARAVLEDVDPLVTTDRVAEFRQALPVVAL